ncbi:hypothetical protein HNQ77_001433 [Silvibacterium bohemicum]|uniref:Uncharacterized protein n=1 Tax=Silvibacterium bohemicum TaxID=1577686 RepID=A0A841JUR0_9BACT|nr:hypothetical protein [Silvibacterium bohemicum]MBB6143489.1 hypothetical protein [Silvibacterium bohemicum]
MTTQVPGAKWILPVVFAAFVYPVNSQAQQRAIESNSTQAQTQQTAPEEPNPSSANDPNISKTDQSNKPAKLVVPDRAIYRFFLQHVGDEDERFREAEAAGKDTSSIRWDYAKIFNLSDEETAQMLSTAIDGYYSIHAKDQEFNDFIQAERKKYTPYEWSRLPVLPEARRLDSERWALVMSTMNRIHEELGDESFSRLDAAIHRTWGGKLSAVQPISQDSTSVEHPLSRQ